MSINLSVYIEITGNPVLVGRIIGDNTEQMVSSCRNFADRDFMRLKKLQ